MGRVVTLIATIATASVYPIKQCSDVIASDHFTELESNVAWKSLEYFESRVASDIATDMRYNYYAHDIEANSTIMLRGARTKTYIYKGSVAKWFIKKMADCLLREKLVLL